MAHVLVVEDDEGIRHLLQEWLSAEDHLVDGVRTAEEALGEVRHCRPDVVILDLGLPHMDGRAFVAALRQDPRLTDLPIVLVSGRDDVGRAVHELGAAEGLQKPIPLDRLSLLVERLTSPVEA